MTQPDERSDQRQQSLQHLPAPQRSLALHQEGGEEESLRHVIQVLRRRQFAVIACVVAGLAAALLYCMVKPNEYTSTALLLIDRENGGGMDLGAAVMQSLTGEDLKTDLETHTAILRSDSTALRVIEQLHLDQVYAVKPGRFGMDPALKREAGLPLEDAPVTRARLLKIVEGKLSVKPRESTRLISIGYTDRDPQRAAAVANAFVNAYVDEYLQTHFEATARASEWINKQLQSLQTEVADAQKKLTDFESQTGLSTLMMGGGASPQGSTIGSNGSALPEVAKLATLNQEVTAAQSNLITQQAIYQLTQTNNPDVIAGLATSSLANAGVSTAVTEGPGLTEVEALRAQQASLRQQYSDMTTRYGVNNPRLTEMQAQMTSLNQAMQEAMSRVNQRAKNDVDLARRTLDALRNSYDQQQLAVNKLNDRAVQLEVLEGEAISKRSLYEELVTKLQDANIQAGVQATNLNLVDEARSSAKPSQPDWRLYPLIGLAIGLFLGICLAFARESLDDSLVTAEQVEKIGQLPVLSYVPLIRAEDRQTYGAELVAAGVDPAEQSPLLARPNSPAAEAYRALRTAVQLSTVDAPLRALLVTSPVGGDGKTSVSYNLAIAFAQRGKSVLLVDADMRKPRAHTLFGSKKAPGLSEVLTGGARLEGAIIRHKTIESLFLLPCGTIPPNPAELLDSLRCDSVIEELKSKFDLVIFDSPPMLLVTDAVVMTPKVDGTLVILRSQKTTQRVLKRVLDSLQRSHGRKLGFIVNALDTQSVDYYYSYGYYGNKYKYYGEGGA